MNFECKNALSFSRTNPKYLWKNGSNLWSLSYGIAKDSKKKEKHSIPSCFGVVKQTTNIPIVIAIPVNIGHTKEGWVM